MNPLERMFLDHSDPVSYSRAYLRRLFTVLENIESSAIARTIEVLWKAREQGRRIFFIGNGGSAATASHFANDIGVGTRCNPPFRALSLTDNNAVITAIANDFGYETIFAEQLRLHLEPEDVVVAISASGNSPNIIRAVELAQQRGATVVGLTGFDGGRLRELSTIAIHVPTEAGEYGAVEDAHMILDHLMSSFLTQRARKG